jgi:hypothetical protein
MLTDEELTALLTDLESDRVESICSHFRAQAEAIYHPMDPAGSKPSHQM